MPIRPQCIGPDAGSSVMSTRVPNVRIRRVEVARRLAQRDRNRDSFGRQTQVDCVGQHRANSVSITRLDSTLKRGEIQINQHRRETGARTYGQVHRQARSNPPCNQIDRLTHPIGHASDRQAVEERLRCLLELVSGLWRGLDAIALRGSRVCAMRSTKSRRHLAAPSRCCSPPNGDSAGQGASSTSDPLTLNPVQQTAHSPQLRFGTRSFVVISSRARMLG